MTARSEKSVGADSPSPGPQELRVPPTPAHGPLQPTKSLSPQGISRTAPLSLRVNLKFSGDELG